jgi:hypothetical protein
MCPVGSGRRRVRFICPSMRRSRIWLKAAAEPEAMAMPTEPKISAFNGIQPGEANTMPTMAVNTMSRLTLGLVSSK